jgi:hypothetical protein
MVNTRDVRISRWACSKMSFGDIFYSNRRPWATSTEVTWVHLWKSHHLSFPSQIKGCLNKLLDWFVLRLNVRSFDLGAIYASYLHVCPQEQFHETIFQRRHLVSAWIFSQWISKVDRPGRSKSEGVDLPRKGRNWGVCLGQSPCIFSSLNKVNQSTTKITCQW